MTDRRSIIGPQPGETTEIDRELILGREGDIVVDDPEASRRHAAVRPARQGVEVEDLGSRNGTLVDGHRVEGKLLVRESATLRVGATDLRIEISLPDVTRVRKVPEARPTAISSRPEFQPTVARGVPQAPASQQAARESVQGGAGRGRRVVPIAGSVAATLVIAIVAILLLAGGSPNSVNPNCEKHFAGWIKDGFPEPPTVESHGGRLDEKLAASKFTIHDNGHLREGMHYDGVVPGPTLVFCRADTLHVALENKLSIPTNLHVHGLHVSPQGAEDNIFVALNPLQSHQYTYKIPLNQPQGTFWYHPHFHPLVTPETTAGLLGALIVEGGLDRKLANIPQRLIVIHGGEPLPPGGKPLPIPGLKPGTIKLPPKPGPNELLVNGAFQPTLHIRPGELQRWRVLNGTGVRYVKLAMPGTTFELLAIDGNTLHEMRQDREILIGPGERVEVLVRGGGAGSYQLNSVRFQPCFKGCFDPAGGVPTNGRDFGFQTLVKVVSTGSVLEGEQLPSGPLANPPDLRQAHVDVERTIVMARRPAFTSIPQFPLNNRLFNANRTDITMALNSVEQWTIKSPNGKDFNEWHNFHIHTNNFQVVAINGKSLDYVDWQDTVNVPAGGSVTIRIHPIDYVGRSVFHCHIAFHEDNGMMGVFQIVKNPQPSEVAANKVVYLSPMRNARTHGTTVRWVQAGRIGAFWCKAGLGVRVRSPA